MKKFLLMLLAVLMLVSSAVLPMSAMTLEESGGITFDDNSKYQLSKQFEEIPMSFEAWVYIPKDTGRAGSRAPHRQVVTLILCKNL